MIVSKDWVFVHLQKTGGSFAEKFLLDNFKCESVFPKHRGITTMLPDLQDHFRFGCIRNPYDWYVSWWSSNTQAKTTLFPKVFDEETKADFGKFLHRICELDYDIQHDLDFEEIHKNDIGVYTYRYIKCYCVHNFGLAANCPDEAFLMDKIIRTENLNEELADALELKGRKRRKLLRAAKVHKSEHKDYNEYYTQELKDIIRHKDRIIFERWYNGTIKGSQKVAEKLSGHIRSDNGGEGTTEER